MEGEAEGSGGEVRDGTLDDAFETRESTPRVAVVGEAIPLRVTDIPWWLKK